MSEFKKTSKEFYEVREAFERFMKHSWAPRIHGICTDRADKESKYFYENGELNNIFKTYLAGYMLARHIFKTKDEEK